jgi:uncharacterized protein (TIGR03085 family)
VTTLARTERAAFCETALQVGEDRPTLCGGWTVKDLVAHLLVRERSPAAVGIAVPPLAGLTERAYRKMRRRDFSDLVEMLRSGPPRLSPYSLPGVDALLNGAELFVHHEDVRRAQPGWRPRELSDEDQRTLWSVVRTAGKGLTRPVPVGLTLRNTATQSTAVLHKGSDEAGSDMVTLSGPPSELVLYVFGRSAHSLADLDGDPSAVIRLLNTTLRV